MPTRKRSPKHSCEQNLETYRSKLHRLPHETREKKQRDALNKKIKEVENAIHMNGWLQSSLVAPN